MFHFFALGSRDVDKRDKSPSASEAKTPVIRKGLEVDKFGFYHAQPVAAAAPSAASSSSTYDTSKAFLPFVIWQNIFQAFHFFTVQLKDAMGKKKMARNVSKVQSDM